MSWPYHWCGMLSASAQALECINVRYDGGGGRGGGGSGGCADGNGDGGMETAIAIMRRSTLGCKHARISGAMS